MHESLIDKLNQLEQKFAASGQDLAAYLEGLLQADYLTYWDYIHLETLLSLQNPKTSQPDELVFVTYHQITELYFKLILHEIAQIANAGMLTAEFFVARMGRLNRYFGLLEESFGVMIAGLNREQFLKFRMALLPTSGFQSAQFRQIEIASTDFRNLLIGAPEEPEYVSDLYEFMYWKQGAIDLVSQQKTLTLQQFDQHYGPQLIRMAEEHQGKNLLHRYQQLERNGQSTLELVAALREYDWRVNIRWKLSHLRSAVRHLKQEQEIQATGGTNWQTYLPPKQQRIMFFPELWTEEELTNWGKSAGLPGAKP
ncbi:tryptophan 2,3-dioxygenase family protein [Spirosoma validum]|uniref:Tryptophan 2,3-dioxygenase n=1 Tax=Spirosoma validum TaxID=2771355 RepID=A0A927B7A3_9BACT|nr:tryptophan 2,3-dioxygenase family protein [Spirosoma validum]MBD2756512.1 tryptophan 2,3-dioxygenase [Spirosoma validum]